MTARAAQMTIPLTIRIIARFILRSAVLGI